MKNSPEKEMRILANREATKRPVSGPNSLSALAQLARQRRGNHKVGYQSDPAFQKRKNK